MDQYPALYFPQLQQLVPLEKFGRESCVVGRDPEASVPLADLTCSRRQFSVAAGESGYEIQPLSPNVPTLLNGQPLAGPAVLEHNHQISCGSTVAVYLARQEDAVDAAPGVRFRPRNPRPAEPTIAGPPPGPRPPGPPLPPAPFSEPSRELTIAAGPPPGPRPPAPPLPPAPFSEPSRELTIAAGPPPGPRPPAPPPPPAPFTEPSREPTIAAAPPPGPRPPAPPPEPSRDREGATKAPPRPTAATVVGNFRDRMEAVQHPAGEIPLDRNAVIGREPDSGGIVLEHPRVSRRHAEVRVNQDKVFLRDLGSANGTFLNGERITSYREVQKGDRIDIGPYSFRFTGRGLAQSTREGNLRVAARNLTRTVRSHSDGQTIRILDDVNLVVEPGEFVCILGSSGSGKSTLMQALSARTPADQGHVFLNEVSLYANFQTVKQSIALVPQKDLLHEDLTLEECILYTARLRLPPDTAESGLKAAVGQALERVDLKHRGSTPIRHLSGGQKKRAALANETVSRPELLFLDEVTSGLDEGTDWEMMRLFRRMADDGMTVVCVTHTVANVEDFCHKIVVMTAPGVLAYYGPPAAARQYFGVEKLGDIYRKLAESPGVEWRNRFLGSEEHRRYIGQPLESAPVEAATPAQLADQTGRFQDQLPEVRRQFGILTSRFSKLLAADRKTLGIAFAQSALIGIFLVLVFGAVGPQDGKQFPLLFFLGISCFWCGCNNASKEIVKERFLYAMERDVNLSVAGYVLSKMIMLSLFGVVQVALLFAIVSTFGTVPGDGAREFLAMAVSVLAGTATGLFLSAVARTEDQASTLVPIALIPQILLAGIIVPDLPKFPDLIAHLAISGFWVYRSMQSVLTGRMEDANFALLVLLVHTLVFLAGAGVVLFARDSRGQMVWGKAINARMKG